MIHIINFFPSLDHDISIQKPELGKIGTVFNYTVKAGGKGLNVACLLSFLKVPNHLWVVLGDLKDPGTIFFNQFLKKNSINATVFNHTGILRSNFSIQLNSKSLGKFNQESASMDPKMLSKIESVALSEMKSGDWVVLNGRLPRENARTYYHWIQKLHLKKIKVFLDSSGLALKYACDAGPDFLKINRFELSEILKGKIHSLDQVKKLHGWFLTHHIVSGAITEGPQGALLWENHKMIRVAFEKRIQYSHTLGAGDAFLAGYLFGLYRKWNLNQRIRYATTMATKVARNGIDGFFKNKKLKIENSIHIKLCHPQN
jgi:1-phosphofructokinase